MSKAKTNVEQSKEKPELSRDYLETRALEASERADNAIKMGDRKRAAAEAALIEDILNATR